MHALALLRCEAAARLRAVLRPGDHMQCVPDARALAGAIAGPASVVVIDPDLVTGDVASRLCVAMRRAGIPFVIALSPLPASAAATLALLRGGASDVIVDVGTEDARILRARFDRLPVPPLSVEIVRALAPRLLLVPTELAAAVVILFGAPSANDSPKALAERAGMARRTLDRWMSRIGIRSTRLLVAAARLGALHDAMMQRRCSATATIRNSRLGSAEAIRRQCHALTGGTLRDLCDIPRQRLLSRMDERLAVHERTRGRGPRNARNRARDAGVSSNAMAMSRFVGRSCALPPLRSKTDVMSRSSIASHHHP